MNNINPSDLYYYSDMDIFEFTAANRPLFERLGAKSWEECQAMAEHLQPTLPHKPRPYTRTNGVEQQQKAPAPVKKATRQWIEVQGEALQALYTLSQQSGKSYQEIVSELLLKQ